MQQIINVLLKNRTFILFLALLFVSFIFIKNRSLYHQSKLNKIAIELTGSTYNITKSINDYFNLKEINNNLLIENKILLKNQINGNKKISYNKSKIPYEVIEASIIKNSTKSSRNYLITNKGEKDGIKMEMGVISIKGIVGVINNASENYSSIISILNKDLQINAKFKKNNAFGSLNWDGLNPNIINLNDISEINEVKIGDSIVTGGMSTYFPEGILIGIVKDFKLYPEMGYYQIKVSLNNIVGNEFNVFIIKNNSQDKIKSLE